LSNSTNTHSVTTKIQILLGPVHLSLGNNLFRMIYDHNYKNPSLKKLREKLHIFSIKLYKCMLQNINAGTLICFWCIINQGRFCDHYVPQIQTSTCHRLCYVCLCARWFGQMPVTGCLEWGKWTGFNDNILKALVESPIILWGMQVNFHTGRKPTANQSASHSMNRS